MLFINNNTITLNLNLNIYHDNEILLFNFKIIITIEI